MYLDINDEYKEYINRGKIPPNTEITGTITLQSGEVLSLNNANLIMNSLSINNKCCGSSNLELGTTYIGECCFKFITDLYLYDLYDGKVEIYYEAVGNKIPLGVYFISEATRTNKILDITAYDAMNNTDESIGNLTTNGKPYSVLKWICKNCGLELANTEEEISKMANADNILNVSSNSYSTYRDALKDVSMVLGGFATINRFGLLEIRQYQTKPNAVLLPRQRKSQKIAEYTTFISEMDATVDGVTYRAVALDNTGLTYNLSNKMIIGLVSTVQPMVQEILDSVSDLKYTPAEYQIIYNPIYDLGDLIDVIADGDILKKDLQTTVTSFSYTFQGSSKLQGVGASIFLSKRNKTASETAYDSASSYAKNNGTYIEVYENIEKYNVGPTKKKVVSIDYGNGNADVIVLHGQCCINCTTAGTIQFIYGCDGEDESFSPKHKLVEGYNTIDFYCYFLEPEANWLSTYTVDLISQDAIGTIEIGDIRADVMATMYGNGKFITNNIFEEQIPFMPYQNNLIPYWEKEEEDGNE